MLRLFLLGALILSAGLLLLAALYIYMTLPMVMHGGDSGATIYAEHEGSPRCVNSYECSYVEGQLNKACDAVPNGADAWSQAVNTRTDHWFKVYDSNGVIPGCAVQDTTEELDKHRAGNTNGAGPTGWSTGH